MESFYLLVGLGGLLIVILALNVSRIRIKEQIAHGDSGNKVLRNAIQAHSNAFEQIIPFSLIIFVLISQDTNSTIIQTLAISFLVLRMIHAWGITKFIFKAWQLSAGFSYVLTIFSAGLIFYNLIQ